MYMLPDQLSQYNREYFKSLGEKFPEENQNRRKGAKMAKHYDWLKLNSNNVID